MNDSYGYGDEISMEDQIANDEYHREEDRWSDEERAKVQADVRRFLPDAELLENGEFVRLGERFGWIVCYDDEAGTMWSRRPGSRATRVRFHDVGPFLPYDDRPVHARADHNYSMYLREIQEDAEEKASMKRLNKLMDSNPMGKRTRLDLWMQKYVHGEYLSIGIDEASKPDVRVFCAAKSGKGRCGEKLGDVWHTPRGYWMEAQYVPFNEAIPGHLANAQYALDNRETIGEELADLMRQTALAWADMIDSSNPDRPEVMRWDGALNDPDPGCGLPPWLVLGCTRHGNAGIDYPSFRKMVKDARRAGKGVQIDVSKRMLGTIDWTASDN